ncbi:MAG: energy-coupling factor ABC transporter ATP-binding protein [Christensenellales bacterium]|jgi:energy-coupling factor transport system ATP-binding protein|nr:ABC transporter ATP-binding protein [Clostridiales bacterium]
MKLKVNRLGLKYGKDVIFNNLSFELNEGEILAFKGLNGSGKSSLCSCLTGLFEEDFAKDNIRGEILYDNINLNNMSIAEKCNAFGLIFQNPDDQLFSPLVIEELAFAPENLNVPREEIQRRIDLALKTCKIEHLKNAKINTLSGGEKQLVAIASILTMQPQILIADEITSRIDKEKIDDIRQILIDFARSGKSVIMISHNENDLKIASRVIVLERGKNYAN